MALVAPWLVALLAGLGGHAAPLDSAPLDSGREFAFQGRVLAPDGHPVADAAVRATVWDRGENDVRVLAEARTDPEGRFGLAYHEADLPPDPQHAALAQQVTLWATAPGFGPGFVLQGKRERASDLTLTLVADAPLSGRVVDTEGRAQGGVAVRLASISAAPGESLDEWLAALKSGGKAWEAGRRVPNFWQPPEALAPATITDAEGRFTLAGIGRERIARLALLGGNVAFTSLRMATRAMETVELLAPDGSWVESVVGNGGTLALEPTRPVEGVVRDALTKQPLAGVAVLDQALRIGGLPIQDPAHRLRAETDAAGHFRLLGFAAGASNILIAVAGDEEPYFAREIDVPDPPGVGPVVVEIELYRGLWITGRVVEPERGSWGPAEVRYLPSIFNADALAIPHLKDLDVDHLDGRYRARADGTNDGTYRVVGLPGKGVLVLLSDGPYTRGIGAEALVSSQGPRTMTGGFMETDTVVVKSIEVPPGASSFACDLAPQSGVTLTLRAVDPDGKPVEGLRVSGAEPGFDLPQEIAGASFEVEHLGPGETRVVQVWAPARNLAVVACIGAEGENPRSLVLRPAASLRGRLRDQDGAPWPHARLLLLYRELEPYSGLETLSDDEGRFVLANIPLGAEYELYADSGPSMSTALEKLALEPGKELDLADLRVERP